MKAIAEKHGENVKAIKVEYSPAEWLVTVDAMERYATDREVHAVDRLIMKHALASLAGEKLEVPDETIQ